MSFKFLIAFGIGIGVYVVVALAIYFIKKWKKIKDEKKNNKDD